MPTKKYPAPKEVHVTTTPMPVRDMIRFADIMETAASAEFFTATEPTGIAAMFRAMRI